MQDWITDRIIHPAVAVKKGILGKSGGASVCLLLLHLKWPVNLADANLSCFLTHVCMHAIVFERGSPDLCVCVLVSYVGWGCVWREGGGWVGGWTMTAPTELLSRHPNFSHRYLLQADCTHVTVS